MSQRYTSPRALERMADDRCPECGEYAEGHSGDVRFWVPRGCDLLPMGVADRIAQYESDRAAGIA